MKFPHHRNYPQPPRNYPQPPELDAYRATSDCHNIDNIAIIEVIKVIVVLLCREPYKPIPAPAELLPNEVNLSLSSSVYADCDGLQESAQYADKAHRAAQDCYQGLAAMSIGKEIFGQGPDAHNFYNILTAAHQNLVGHLDQHTQALAQFSHNIITTQITLSRCEEHNTELMSRK